MPPLSSAAIHRIAVIADLVHGQRDLVSSADTDPNPDCRVTVVGGTETTLAGLDAVLSRHLLVDHRTQLGPVPEGARPHVIVIIGLPGLTAAQVAVEAHAHVEPAGLVIVEYDRPEDATELLDALGERYGVVTNLAQATVDGFGMLPANLSAGLPRRFVLDPESTTPTMAAGGRGAGVIVAADRHLGHLPTHSTFTVERAPGPSTSDRVRAEATRLARGAARRVRREAVDIVLPSSDEPVLSIVIPVYGQWPMTYQCVAAIAALDLDLPTEVLIVDDASPDNTALLARQVPGLRILEQPENGGFLRAANAGMAAARGSLVLLLNNDTVPQAGSVQAMVARIQSEPSIGIVGAKLVYLDRSLQEAGGVVWNEGTAANLGRNADPADPRFGFVRDVDYCSGAALLIRREVLDATGGFDERYLPAYYEDADLCFEARRLGWRVVYEPAARVVHLEGQSHGTDVGSGLKRHQADNRKVFAAKWAEELKTHYPPYDSYLALGASRLAKRRVLVIDHTVPTHDRDGGSLRMLRILKILRTLGCAVWFVPGDRVLLQPYTRDLLELGVEPVPSHRDLEGLVRDLGSGLDAVIASRRGVAWSIVDLVRRQAPTAALIFDTVDLHFAREAAEVELLGADAEPGLARQADLGRRMELGLVQAFDQTWVVSTDEAALLESLVPGVDVRVIPTIQGSQPTTPTFDERRDLLFVGNFNHPPNQDAMRWSAAEVLPAIRRRLPDVRLHVAGGALPDSVRDELDDGFVVHGWAPDLAELYGSARLAFVPLRYGAGVKTKVTEAFGRGVPVVTTPVGVEGMPPELRALATIGTTAEELADAVAGLYEDRDRWDALHTASPQAIDAVYGEAAVQQLLERALDAAASRAR